VAPNRQEGVSQISVAPLRKRNLDLDIGPTVRTYLASHANGRHIARNLHADATRLRVLSR